jgi:predicted phosphodiesterase
MKFFAISDTHGLHRQVIVPNRVDCILYAGDSTNSKYLNQNLQEFEDFFTWLEELPIKHKIIIAGNHDAWATKAYIRDKLKEAGIL